MIVKLLTGHHLKFLSLKGGCTGSYKFTLVKMLHCWKTHATAQLRWLTGAIFVRRIQTTKTDVFSLHGRIVCTYEGANGFF